MVAAGDLRVEGAVVLRSPVDFLIVLGEPACYWRNVVLVAVLGISVVALGVLGLPACCWRNVLSVAALGIFVVFLNVLG